MHFSAVTAALTLLSSASAIKVLSPHDGSVWSSGSSSQSITWEAVSTDPETFQVQLVNQAGFLPDKAVTLISSQSRGSANQQNTASVSFPSGNWPSGTAFRINLVSTSSDNQAILAQSDEFNITSSGLTNAGAASAGASPSSSTTTMMSGTPPATLGGMRASQTTSTTVFIDTGATNSNGLPNVGTTSTRSAAELVGVPSGFFAAVIGVATFFGVFA